MIHCPHGMHPLIPTDFIYCTSLSHRGAHYKQPLTEFSSETQRRRYYVATKVKTPSLDNIQSPGTSRFMSSSIASSSPPTVQRHASHQASTTHQSTPTTMFNQVSVKCFPCSFDTCKDLNPLMPIPVSYTQPTLPNNR